MTDAELKALIEARGLRLSERALEVALQGARYLRGEVAKVQSYLDKDDRSA